MSTFPFSITTQLPAGKLLLAVSGGLDSVVLLHACKEAGRDIAIAHVNYGLRGEESNADEIFVRSLAAKFDIPIFTLHPNTKDISATEKKGIQEVARSIRYTWFDKLIKEEGYAYVVTAHHADDNIETLLMNFFRGTGINGLKAMQGKRDRIVRPLLQISRDEILAYATTHGLTWREDSSNASNDYTRNAIRNEIIPMVEKYFPAFRQNMQQNISRFEEIKTIYDAAMKEAKAGFIFPHQNMHRIPVLKVQRYPAKRTLLYELLEPFGFNAQGSEEVLKLLESETGKYRQGSTHRIIRNRKWLDIVPVNTTDADEYILEEGNGELGFARGKLNWHRTIRPDVLNADAFTLMADMTSIQFPLLFRKWKTGDYFYPLGMKHKKKINRFLIDQKAAQWEKENTWVLLSGDRIIWVAGIRMDDRFKVRPSTTEILHVKLFPAK